MKNKENVLEDDEMRKKKESQKLAQELEDKVIKLRSHKPDTRLFKADTNLVTSGKVRVNKGQTIQLPADQDNPHLIKLSLQEEVHYRQTEPFLRG